MLYVVSLISIFFFFFSSRRRHTRFKCDWSSDVCSSDLANLDAKTSAVGNCSRKDFGACSFRHRFGLAGDHGLVTVSSTLNNRTICRNSGPGPPENDVANAQLRDSNPFICCALYPFPGSLPPFPR